MDSNYNSYSLGLNSEGRLAFSYYEPTIKTTRDETKLYTEEYVDDLKRENKKLKKEFENLLLKRQEELKSYIINKGATILFWKDGSKTIVKISKGEKFDKRLGFLTAYFQKHCGMSKTKANKFLDNLEVQE